LNNIDRHQHATSSLVEENHRREILSVRAQCSSIDEQRTTNEIDMARPNMSNSMKWYVSELRINRPLIYRTRTTCREQRTCSSRLSHSFDHLNQFEHCPIDEQHQTRTRTTMDMFDPTSALHVSRHSWHCQQQSRHYQSMENIACRQCSSHTEADVDQWSDNDTCQSRTCPSVTSMI
jgi:hypothetical protein